MLSVGRVREAIAGKSAPALGPCVGGPHAAVAIVLAGEEHSPRVCFMQRVEREGNRWSGDVSLPGGWAKEGETAFSDTAARETREEVGIVLDERHHLGDVAPLNISRHGNSGGTIAASVFYRGVTLPPLTPDPQEVADAFWVPAAHLYDPGNRTLVYWSRSGPPRPRPAVEFEGRVIWGLTYRILTRFSTLVLGRASPLELDAD